MVLRTKEFPLYCLARTLVWNSFGTRLSSRTGLVRASFAVHGSLHLSRWSFSLFIYDLSLPLTEALIILRSRDRNRRAAWFARAWFRRCHSCIGSSIFCTPCQSRLGWLISLLQLGILAHSFPPSKTRSVAFATFAAGAPVGAAIGSTIGGVLTQLTECVVHMYAACTEQS